MNKPNRITLSLHGRELTLSCPLEEESTLKEAADLLDDRLNKMRSAAPNVGFERITLITALNIAGDLIRSSKKTAALENALENGMSEDRAQNLSERIDAILNRFETEGSV